MSVRLGNIELTRLQVVGVDEGRKLVEHPLPGSAGSVFQDLGRGAIGLYLRAILLGEAALREIEILRAAHADATPLSFSADIAVGSELTDVIIEDFQIRQIAGHRHRYELSLSLREWIEPAPSAGAALAAVNAGILAEAETWSSQAVSLVAALDNPGSLADLLTRDPGLLSRMNPGDLLQVVLGNMGRLSAADFAHLLSAISDANPETVITLVSALAQADSLEDLFQIMAGSGIQLMEQLTGLDLSQASPLIIAFLGGPEFLDDLDKVKRSAKALLDALNDFDPLGELAELADGPGAAWQGAQRP